MIIVRLYNKHKELSHIMCYRTSIRNRIIQHVHKTIKQPMSLHIIQQGQQEVDEEMAHYRERWAHHVRVISNVCQKCRAQNSSRRSSISLSNIPKDTIVSLVDHEVYGRTIYMFFFGFSTRFAVQVHNCLLTYTKNELNVLAMKTAK